MFGIFAILHVMVAVYLVPTNGLSEADCGCDIDYKSLGCYYDNGQRPLPTQILNERDPKSNVFGGNKIEWGKWSFYLPQLVCRCARKAKELQFKYFSIQFYGECWAGNDDFGYKRIGLAPAQKCVDKNFAPCVGMEKDCVGVKNVNFVYQLEDTSCPNYEFERVGCFRDKHNNNRPLENYILTERDPTLKNILGDHRVDWANMDTYLPEFACRCAQKAKADGQRVFGLQYWGECYTGPVSNETYNLDGSASNCNNMCYGRCISSDRYCVGDRQSIFAYRLKGEPCVNPYIAVGCLQQNPNSLFMKELLVTEKDPSSPFFDGHYSAEQSWPNRFQEFVCACALRAREKSYTFFSVTKDGECYSSTGDPSSLITQRSDECVKVDSQPCDYTTSSLCGGINTSVFVYKLGL